MKDTLQHQQLRQALVREISQKGIYDVDILNALARIPRHLFLNAGYSATEAYKDTALEIGEGQTISQPYTVAYQTQLLDIKQGDRVLEIGTGSGYQAAVLAELGAEVYSLERQITLYKEAGARLARLGYSHIKLFFRDGNEGLPEYEPFDKILVTAGATQVPSILLDELKPGGIMVIPVGTRVQKMLRVIKTSASESIVQEHDNFHFVKFLAGTVGG